MATLTFLRYTVEDAGVAMEFFWPNPGPGKDTNYTIRLTDAELAAVTTQPQLTALVTSELQRKIQAAGVASKLDPFLNQTVTI